jgi:hypothetical protein
MEGTKEEVETVLQGGKERQHHSSEVGSTGAICPSFESRGAFQMLV